MRQKQDYSLTPEQREAYSQHLMPAYRKPGGLPLKDAKGIYLIDQDGKKYIDFTSGMFVSYLGFGNEEIAETIYEQAKGLTIVAPLHQTDLRYSLYHKIATIAPKNMNRMSFSVGGGPAMESAMKIALKNVKGARNFVTLWGGYHGGTLGVASATFTTSRLDVPAGHQPPLFQYTPVMANNCLRVPQPYCYRCPFARDPEKCGLFCAEWVKETILHSVIGPTAAVIVEPIQSAGGQMPFPSAYLKRIREICDETGVLLIFDEFQTYCRTGEFFAAQYYDVEPDVLTFAKGLGAGLPLAGILIRDDIVPFEDLTEDLHTFQNNHVSYAAALKAIEIIERDHLLENTKQVGAYFTQRLHELQKEYPEIGDVRGPGLAIGVEMVKDPVTKEPLSAKVMDQLFHKCIEHGLFFQIAHNIIKIKPAITITLEEAQASMDMFERGLKDVLRS